MGKKLNLSHLTDEERDQIMTVLQKDFEIRKLEKKRINEVHDELVKEKNRIAALKDKPKFNETSCLICLERFGVLFRRKRKCYRCDINVCSDCSQGRPQKKKGFICAVCSKEKEFKMLSNQWFYDITHVKDKTIGSSKVVRSLYKRDISGLSDTEEDSGYNQSSISSSATQSQHRSKLDSVFDLSLTEDFHVDHPHQQSPEVDAHSGFQTVLPQPRPRSITSSANQTSYHMAASQSLSDTSQGATNQFCEHSSSSTETTVPVPRQLRRKDEERHAMQDEETFQGAKHAEESKFRVKFVRLIEDLSAGLENKESGLSASFASPLYGEAMLKFKDSAKDLVKEFAERLHLVYEGFSSGSPDSTALKVKQNICDFLEDFLGENVHMTPDSSTLILPSVLYDHSNDQDTFEDTIAQAVVTKIMENHRKEISETLDKENDQYFEEMYSNAKLTIAETEKIAKKKLNSKINKVDMKSHEQSKHFRKPVTESSKYNDTVKENVTDEESQTIQERMIDESDDDSRLYDAQDDFTPNYRPDHEDDTEELYARYSALERIRSSRSPLNDISPFNNIDFTLEEVDPDLLALNLDIIPEEDEEELEEEAEKTEDNARVKTNWSFKDTDSMHSRNVENSKDKLHTESPFYLRVASPDITHLPKVGNRNVDQLSDFSDFDGSDEEENTFYANTSKELARISGQQKRSGYFHLGGYYSDDSDLTGKSVKLRLPPGFDQNSADYADFSGSSDYISGSVAESSLQDITFLQETIPAENNDPLFVVPPESVTVQEGDSVKFSCQVAGTAPIDVFWYRESDEVEELEESGDVEVTNDEDRHSIVIFNVNKMMAGQYICIAVNEKGKTIQYLVVTVKDNKQEMKKPEFLKGLKDVEVTEGQSVKLRVKVKGYPPPRVSWYKDERLLKSSKACRIEKFGNRDYILVIDYASMDDDAEYSVVARNVVGEERMSAQIIVEPQSDLPIRRYISSTTTSGVSDSDSDRPLSYHSLILKSKPDRIETSLTASTTLSNQSDQDRSVTPQNANQFPVDYLERKRTLTQAQNEVPSTRRLLTHDVLDVLKVADDIIHHEKHPSVHAQSERNKNEAILASEHATQNKTSAMLSGNSMADSCIQDFFLPAILNDDIMPARSINTQEQTPITCVVSLASEGDALEHPDDSATTGPIRLPSVDKLKTVFSSIDDDDLGNGTLRRVHSITARNVPKETLEKLRSSNENQSSPEQPDPVLEDQAALLVSSPIPAEQQQLNSDTPTQLYSSEVNKRLIPSSRSVKLPQKELYISLDHHKDPVLIYPQPDPEYIKRTSTNQQQNDYSESSLASMSDKIVPHEDQHQKVDTIPVPRVRRSSKSPARPEQSEKQQVQQVQLKHENVTLHTSGPRIKSGSISARTAFWERKIVLGEAANNEDFPEIMENSET